jgi:hypothetical protein
MRVNSEAIPINQTPTTISGNEPAPILPDAHISRLKNPINLVSDSLIIISITMLVIVVMVMAAVPPVSRDALTHHLAIPKLWIENGGIVALPNLVFSYYPMNLDLLYVLPMILGNDVAPKYIHFIFALATAGMVYRYLQLRTSRTLSMLGVLLFLSTPVIVKLSISVYVDLGLIFFSWASIYHLLAWARTRESPKHLVFSAIFCGLGLGTKYNGMIVLILLTLFVPGVHIRSSGSEQTSIKQTVGYSILFFVIAMAVFSPWMIRNYRLTRNPVYPMYNQLIGTQPDTSEISNMTMKPWLQRRVIYKESALETALIPIRIFFQGQDDNPRLFDGKLNPILCLFPLFLVFGRKESDQQLKLEQWFLVAYSMLFMLIASYLVDMRVRYIAPIIPPLVVLTVLGLEKMLCWADGIKCKHTQMFSHCLIVGSIFCFLSMNATYGFALFRSVNPLPYLSGEMSRERYLLSKLPEYAAIQFLNKRQDEDVKVLALFVGKRRYYFDQPVEMGTLLFADMLAASSNAENLASRLNAHGFTHMVIGIQHFENWANLNLTNEQKQLLSHWGKKNCIPLFSQNGYIVYRLKTSASTDPSTIN